MKVLAPKYRHSLLVPLLAAFAWPAWADVAVEEEVIESNVRSEETRFDVVRVVGGLTNPWGIDWLPDGRMLVTERPGRLQLIDGDRVIQVDNVPLSAPGEEHEAPDNGQGGLLDVAVHPQYEENGWIYFTYSSPGDDDAVAGDDDHGTATALYRARLSADGSQLVDGETLYASLRTDPGRHYGSRIVFPDEDTVVFSIGDRGLRRPSQDLTDSSGSVIRLNMDGGAVEDNPFVGAGQGNLRPEIYAFGTRNIQGMVVHPESGDIWALEHGPQGGDLLFQVEEGDNLGWPYVAYGPDYSTSEHIGVGREAPGVKEPAYVWEDSMAPSGLAYYNGDAFPEWQGNFFAGSLRQQQLHRLELGGNDVIHEEILLTETIGRIRDVSQGPDGNLYVITDEEDGGVYMLRPSR
ncbi:PQQ-dependent sugar dehydrogenase [Marinimicrobium sp. ABcell2]|uniref:PQQ-dependent sugar dehydrogenase n=1 Tax=Marinimicrobium sp. ABcell2 TaxID=3069751 RepID=UPI0027B7CF16|nr:PQQ-dependent sugar dehydrogenase [Marinimicrobium sp. ABcell2]MDQ2078432.1 PQQ-dependent sugar dehydrogenase [Marinimicrobium sp. ABcell2]